MKRVVVVGGGPAGLAAAIFAARSGASVRLLERNDRCGAKLLTTGGGRCNVSNRRSAGEWPALFGRRGRFIVPALDFLPLDKLTSWLAELGQPLVSTDGFHLFPASQSARAVRDALLAEALRLGVSVDANARVSGVTVEEGRAVAVELEDGTVACDRVILATGGASYPATGSTWDGCRMAERLGHPVAPPVPGLVGLRAAEPAADLAGLVLPDAAVFFKSRGRREVMGTGELLLTHTGLSGPAVLDLSADVCEMIAGSGETATLRVRWLRSMDGEAWRERLAAWRSARGGTPVATLLRECLPQRLARRIVSAAGLDEAAVPAALTASGREALVVALAAHPVRVVSGEGWERAMITRGGVDVRRVDPGTLASRLVSGLFFAGEMLDVDGPCGGFNLHWAFAGGALAGTAASL